MELERKLKGSQENDEKSLIRFKENDHMHKQKL